MDEPNYVITQPTCRICGLIGCKQHAGFIDAPPTPNSVPVRSSLGDGETTPLDRAIANIDRAISIGKEIMDSLDTSTVSTNVEIGGSTFTVESKDSCAQCGKDRCICPPGGGEPHEEPGDVKQRAREWINKHHAKVLEDAIQNPDSAKAHWLQRELLALREENRALRGRCEELESELRAERELVQEQHGRLGRVIDSCNSLRSKAASAEERAAQLSADLTAARKEYDALYVKLVDAEGKARNR